MRHLILPLLLLSTSALADAPRSLTVASSAFVQNTTIPTEYTCNGKGISPPLEWTKVPKNTQSIAVLMDDPDAPKGILAHWIVTNIPATATALSPNAPLPEGAHAMKSDTNGYVGPCPPSGTHHYHFRVFALDQRLGTIGSREELLAAIKGHVLAEGELVGLYGAQH